ncbi:hypothetical protein AOL_s00193g36 [Orbilia oligospora ATCC 24927]|uniref:Uncharacterized protein n=2 Tax=Orbilia oligospora TaxID=2813651 RepID=G1XR37_ARTOA|nr:hypothetical protein AOL_s00193g36 [Orbilia oligospora ATCC 24927]EGX44308.1 hypothetical protein AOL_s00193g36 [Orbilia oligospora ATCC 24927]KAF3273984.1 hypothetical protein TWF970_008189 [Orbilia oligospora]
MATDKRKAPNDDAYLSSSNQLVKRQKSVPRDAGNTVAISSSTTSGGALIKAVPRTSALQAPIMELTGHSGEIFAVRFDPTGEHIASGSFDRTVQLWNTYGDCINYGEINGHRGAVLDLQWSRDGRSIYTATTDSLVADWDVETGQRIRRHVGHEDIVNVIEISRKGLEIILSGSDDGTIGIWDPRSKEAIDYLETNFPITSVAIGDSGVEIYSGGIENDVKVWDLRKKAVVGSLRGHTDTITSLSVSPDGQSLLSNSMDSTVRTWDIRPFAASDRLLKVFEGAPFGLEKNLVRASWSPRGDKIAAGGGDRTVCVWDSDSKKLLYKLPGHKGTINDVRFMPGNEPIIVSASSDRTLLLGELGK